MDVLSVEALIERSIGIALEDRIPHHAMLCCAVSIGEKWFVKLVANLGVCVANSVSSDECLHLDDLHSSY